MIVKIPRALRRDAGRRFENCKIAKGNGKAIMLEWVSFSAGRTEEAKRCGIWWTGFSQKRRRRPPWLLDY
jgi:hypothetical protein